MGQIQVETFKRAYFRFAHAPIFLKLGMWEAYSNSAMELYFVFLIYQMRLWETALTQTRFGVKVQSYLRPVKP